MQRRFPFRKATQALNFFAVKEGGSINKMKSIKLIWLSDRLHLRKHGRTISSDTYYALKLGPVPSRTVNLAQASVWADQNELEYRNDFLQSVNERSYRSLSAVDIKQFSKSELDVLQTVYDTYGHLDQWQLSELSHLYPEWERFEKELDENPKGRFDMEMADFFKPSKDQHDTLFDQEEAYLAVAQALFADAMK